jgi:hypothetical protein
MELSKNFEPGSIEEKWTSHWKSKDILILLLMTGKLSLLLFLRECYWCFAHGTYIE